MSNLGHFLSLQQFNLLQQFDFVELWEFLWENLFKRMSVAENSSFGFGCIVLK